MKIEINTENKTSTTSQSFTLLWKTGFIGFITLVLLIPAAFITELIQERQQRKKEVEKDISHTWAGPQLIQGPVLMIPYGTATKQTKSADAQVESDQKYIFLLPDTLQINAKTKTEVRSRGIFDATVFQSYIDINGNFNQLNTKNTDLDPAQILWSHARLVFSVSDLKGLKNNPRMLIGTNEFPVEPDFSGMALFEKCLVSPLNLDTLRHARMEFSYSLDLRGSRQLHFLHLGRETKVISNGDWQSPGFTGRMLPDTRTISPEGYSASWIIPGYNRPWPQQWIGLDQALIKQTSPNQSVRDQDAPIEGTFGISFINTLDSYQKVYRTVRYAVLIILLTCIALLCTEWITRRRIHVLQYLLIGVAMVVYYTLLLAFSEQMSYGWAYLAASLSTITLISLFVRAVLQHLKASLTIAGLLALFYSFVYYIIQLEDLALIAGSLGLFVVVGILMYLSQKIISPEKENA